MVLPARLCRAAGVGSISCGGSPGANASCRALSSSLDYFVAKTSDSGFAEIGKGL